MFRIQMGMHSRSTIFAGYGMPCAIPPQTVTVTLGKGTGKIDSLSSIAIQNGIRWY
jgi:hypothetical protein